MRGFFKTLIVVVALSLSLSGSELKIMTEDYPPFNYENDNGKLTGFSVEIVEEMAKRVGYKKPIELLPWSRAYNLTLNKDGYALFSMTRNSAREDLFEWVGPLVPNKSVLWGVASREYSVNSLDDLKNYKIGTYKDDADEIRLKELGLEANIDSVIKDDLNLKKLLSGKIDLWVGGDPGNLITAKKAGKGDEIKRVFVLAETQMYLAFSKSTDKAEIKKWQDALDALKQNGFYDKVWDKYFK
jgi:polar amino acid transport system substrate-binding protein